MKAQRIKIIQTTLDSYWYAGYIGNEYWAEERLIDGIVDYMLIEETTNPTSLLQGGKRWVSKADCIVLKEAYIRIDSVTTTKVVEI
jgi:hypothetical protein